MVLCLLHNFVLSLDALDVYGFEYATCKFAAQTVLCGLVGDSLNHFLPTSRLQNGQIIDPFEPTNLLGHIHPLGYEGKNLAIEPVDACT